MARCATTRRRLGVVAGVVASVGACLVGPGATPAGAAPATLPVSVPSAAGANFTFGQTNCIDAFGIQDAGADAFDTGGIFAVDGTFFTDADGTVDVDAASGTVTPDAATISGLVVQPQWRVLADNTARLVIAFTNPSGAAANATVRYETNFGSDSGTTLLVTGPDQNFTLDPTDRSMATSDNATTPVDSVNATAWGNFFGNHPTSLAATTSYTCSGNQGLAVEYAVDVPPGATRRLMFFQSLRANNSDGIERAMNLTNATRIGLADPVTDLLGIPADQAPTIVNWGIAQFVSGGGATYEFGPPAANSSASICSPPSGPSVFSINDARLGSQLDAFDTAGLVTVAGEYVNAPPGTMIRNGPSVSSPPQVHGGLNTQVEYRVGVTAVRLVLTMTNPSGAFISQPVTVETAVGSDNDTFVIGTSSGDATFDAADRWIFTNDISAGGDPAVVSVVGGPGNPTTRPLQPTICGPGARPVQHHAHNFSVMVPPFSTRYLMTFYALAADDAGGFLSGATFDANPSPASDRLAGLTPAHLARILNWDLAPPTVTGVSPPTLGRGETTDVVISGTGLLGDSTVSFGPGVTVNAINPVSDTQLIANVTTSTAASTGTRAVTVSRAGGSSGSCPGCVQVVRSAQGYWMLEADGDVYPFGGAVDHGDANTQVGATGTGTAVDIEPTPSGNGYWVLDSTGNVHPFGDAADHGDLGNTNLAPGERASAISATIDGNGYWIFTNRGRAVTFGNAVAHGGMENVPLNGPVLDSIITASGNGYYMVASDGGIFSFGDAQFRGSMGAAILNAPVQSLVPDADGVGYWLVASDGGIFAFDADFRGSMGATPLAKPVTGMIRFGNGYLMVAEDGGIFNFSDRPFYGSLGANPPPNPITSVAAYAP